jgi:hypothetical protein
MLIPESEFPLKNRYMLGTHNGICLMVQGANATAGRRLCRHFTGMTEPCGALPRKCQITSREGLDILVTTLRSLCTLPS